MKPLKTIYWLRLALGIVAALVCIGFGLTTGVISSTEFSFNVFMNGVSIAILLYLLSYYIIKWRFMHEVEKSSKLMTTGIGIYLLSWIVLWVLLYTLLAA